MAAVNDIVLLQLSFIVCNKSVRTLLFLVHSSTKKLMSYNNLIRIVIQINVCEQFSLSSFLGNWDDNPAG